MNNVTLLTVQHENVLDILVNDKVYYSSEKYIADDRIAPYQELMKEYQYEYYPVFANVIGLHGNCYGIPRNRKMYLFELIVPKTYIRYQDYYDWSDFMYYTECPDEWDDTSPTISLDEFKHEALIKYKDVPDKNKTVPIQATIPYIRPEWLSAHAPLPDAYDRRHNGRINLVMPFHCYV